jgi:hypothetical protein
MDPRLVPKSRQCPAHEVRAQARFHTDDAFAFDLPTQGNPSIGAQSDEVKDLLADVDADHRR